MTATQRQQAAWARIQAGLPVQRCPECDEYGAHWVADTLDGDGNVVRGYFTCTPKVVDGELSALFDDDDGGVA